MPACCWNWDLLLLLLEWAANVPSGAEHFWNSALPCRFSYLSHMVISPREYSASALGCFHGFYPALNVPLQKCALSPGKKTGEVSFRGCEWDSSPTWWLWSSVLFHHYIVLLRLLLILTMSSSEEAQHTQGLFFPFLWSPGCVTPAVRPGSPNNSSGSTLGTLRRQEGSMVCRAGWAASQRCCRGTRSSAPGSSFA